MSSDKIAVLGAGNGGTALAADLASRGFEVSLFEHPNLATSFQTIQNNPVLHLHGMKNSSSHLALATTDIEKAVHDVTLINIIVPAHFQESFFKPLLPHLRDKQTVVIWAGNLGSLRLGLLLREHRPSIRVNIIETNTIPYGARKTQNTNVEIFALAKTILYAAFPANQVIDYPIIKLIPNLLLAQDVLSVSLNNPNPIVHPPGSLLNTGQIENSGDEFYLYRDGNTDAVLRTIYQVYLEVSNIASAIGHKMLEYDEKHFKMKTSIMGANFDTLADMSKGLATPKGPTSLTDRYFFEDIAFGLVPLAELGRKAGLECRTINAIINLAIVICKSDFWQTGRTLASLGIENLAIDEILHYVQIGHI